MPDEPKEKPRYYVANPRTLTFDDVMEMFRQLTGREPTPEEIEEARQAWESEESSP